MTQMQVTLIDYMGNDDSIVNAARVSFSREAKHFTYEQNTNLIRYLAEHKHEIPFAHTAITLRVKAPISIRTQCFKHKVGFVENEVSRRYVKTEPELFVPTFRHAPDGSIKQGSGAEIDAINYVEYYGHHSQGTPRYFKVLSNNYNERQKEIHEVRGYDNVHASVATQSSLQQDFITVASECIKLYEHLIELGVAPEQARFILPQGVMTEWVWTGSLLAFARFYNLRSDSHAQKEIQELAYMVGKVIASLFPIGWEALTGD